MAPYQYDRYKNPFVGSIGDLMMAPARAQASASLQVGDAQARAAAASGSAWGSALEGAGRAVAAMPGQIAQAREQAQQTEVRGLQLDEAKRGVANRKAFASTLASTPMLKQNGMDVYDIPALTQSLSAQGIDPSGYVKPLSELNDTFHSFANARQAVVTSGAQKLAAAGNDPALAVHFLDALESNGVATKDQVQHFRDMIDRDGQEGVAKITAYYIGPQKPEVMKPGDVAFNPITHEPIAGMTVPEKALPPSRASFAAAAAAGDATAAKSLELLDAETVRHNQEQERLAGVTIGRAEAAQKETARHNAATEAIAAGRSADGRQSSADVKLTVEGMKAGKLPPLLPGRASKEYVSLMAEAQRQGFDLAGAATDWQATQKHIATMNGAQQLRLNQAVNALPEMLDKVAELGKQWDGGRFAILNRANLAAAKSGAYGKDAATIANALEAQIADVVADLGNVYMGGNSPTDHALSLAAKSLSADWDGTVLQKMVTLAKGNVQIRRNSINNTGVAGASADNPYAAPAPAAPAATSSGVAVTSPSGRSFPFKDQASADAFVVEAKKQGLWK